LNRANRSLKEFDLEKPDVSLPILGPLRLIQEELNYDREILNTKWLDGYRISNLEQRMILDTIDRAFTLTGSPHLFFIDGPSGTGKTFLENLLLARARSMGLIALAVASSGIASILLDGGRTAHSRFRIPLNVDETTVCDIPAQSQLAELIRRTSVLIWDEAPSQNRLCFQAVDRTMRDIRKNDTWFGGIIVIFAGNTSSSCTLNI